MTSTRRTIGRKTAAALAARRAVVQPALRWLAWADLLRGRYLRRMGRAGGPERLLARPSPRSAGPLRERWLIAARTLFPQIHLAIQPVLRPRPGQAHPVFAARPPAREVRTERNVVDRVRELAGPPSRSALPALERPVLARLRESAPAAAGASRSAVAPPLQLVFQRLREAEGALGVTSRARREGERGGGEREGGLAPHPELARRITRALRRTEQRPADVPARVVARREAPAANAGSEPPAAPRGAPAAQGRWNGSPSGLSAVMSGRPAAALPAVNVEALADSVMQRIDDRLHAWRERTGF